MSIRARRPPPRPTSGAVSVTCRGLVYIYRLDGDDVVALSGVDLDIGAGEAVALVGPSGSGKSTLLALMAGLLRPAAGRLLVGGKDLGRAGEDARRAWRCEEVGVVLQDAERNLVPYLSAEENVRFAQRGASRRRRAALDSPRAVLSMVGIDSDSVVAATPDQLSPGQRQRLAVAAGIASGAGVLLADEPTSQLDSEGRDEVLEALSAVNAAGRTVVAVSHDPVVGKRLGRTVTIRDGRVGAEGRGGEDYLVVGADGSVYLPAEHLEALPPGTLLRVEADADGIRLQPAPGQGGEEGTA